MTDDSKARRSHFHCQGTDAQHADDGTILPYPDDQFTGRIGPTTNESHPAYPPDYPRSAPPGAPNILLILTDDVGFGAASTFGGPIPTPSLDRVARHGLRFNRFHTTALCSPTRAALLTGRNPHNANTGIIMERASGYPGYNSILSKSCGTVAETLRQNGYNTAWFGKNHNVPTWEQSSVVGPFDHWPAGMGFEHFYGFIAGDCNQWAPPVYENTTPIEPYVGNPGYHLVTDLADRAIQWIGQQKALDPDKPFFLYFAPGATHAPHHVPEEWIEKFKGQFDHGWDEQRERTWKLQKQLGIIPEGTVLTPRPGEIPAWPGPGVPWLDEAGNEVQDDQWQRRREVFTRMMEVYAAYLHFADHHIGRVLDAIEKTGQLDNTLVIYIMGDNGGSGEGTLNGSANENATAGNGETETLDYLYSIKDELGGPTTFNNYPVGWAWAMSSPLQWMKRYACHFGGTRNGMAMSWPARIQRGPEDDGLRSQFHHVTDVVPTLLEAAGVKQPTCVNGVQQKPLDGISMAYTWKEGGAEAPGTRKTQVFEIFGNRALYHEDGEGQWLACTTPQVFGWLRSEGEPVGLDSFPWELYKLDDDFSEGWNLVAEESGHPVREHLEARQPAASEDRSYTKKLEELKARWWKEAENNQILPLSFALHTSVKTVRERPNITTKGRHHFKFPNGLVRTPEGCAPDIKNNSFELRAEIQVPESGADGVIITQGGLFGGWGLYLKDSHPVWVYRRSEQESKCTRLLGPRLDPGDHTLAVRFVYDYPASREELEKKATGRGGLFILKVDGAEAVRATVDKTVPAIFSADETFDVGLDTGTSVYPDDYAVPFPFNGTLESVTLDLLPLPDHVPPDLREELQDAIARGKSEAARATE